MQTLGAGLVIGLFARVVAQPVVARTPPTQKFFAGAARKIGNTAANRISNAKWRNAHPVAVWAHQVIHLAIKKGFLRPLNGEIGCVDCEREAQHYDHRDYLYPLTVEPVCYYCNFARGRGKNHGLPADHIPATPARYLDDVFGSAPRQKQSEPEQSTAATEQAA